MSAKKPTLVAELEQLFYSYAPNVAIKKPILDAARAWEEAYQERIAELESRSDDRKDVARLDSESPSHEVVQTRCECNTTPFPPCSWCEKPMRDARNYSAGDPDEERW